MDYNLSNLYNIYAELIREIYKDSDKEITYNRKYYSNDNSMVTIALAQCSSNDLEYILNDNLIILSKLPLKFNKKHQQLYNAYINVARLDYNLACDLFEKQLYINDNDKNILRTSIINNFTGNINLFKRDKLIEQMELTNNEMNRLLLYAITNDYRYIEIIIKFYDHLTIYHKNIILQQLLINKYQATNYLLNIKIPLEFRLQIFRFIYQNNYDLYFDLFMHYYNNEIHDIIRDTLFKYIYEYYNDFSLWEDRLYKLNENELELICKKFYDQIFSTKSFNIFYSQCLRFNKWLRKSERLALIQKLKAKTRASKIAYAKTHISWEPDELDILNSIDLKNKLI